MEGTELSPNCNHNPWHRGFELPMPLKGIKFPKLQKHKGKLKGILTSNAAENH